jgi:hypothetical protein
MGYENNAMNLASGSAYNQYGPRGTEDGVVSGGNLHGVGGSTFEAVVYITGDDFNGTTSYDTQLSLPAGSFPIEAVFEISEAFTVGNADNVINIGTNGSESTNGFAIADPETAEVTKDTSGAGTWAAALAANTAVGVSVTGTTAAVTAGSGKAKVIIRYTKV